MSGKFPYHLAGTGGKTTLETVGGSAITAEKTDALVLVLTRTLFDLHLRFLGATLSGGNCTNTSESATVLANLPGHFGLADPGEDLAVLLLVPSGFKFTCTVLGIPQHVLLRGAAIGTITSPLRGQEAEELALLFKQTKGKQEYTTFLLGNETLTNKIEETSINGGAFEQTGQQGTLSLKALAGEGRFEFLVPKALSPLASEQNGAGPNPSSPKVVKDECGDPVNCATGNLAESQTDIAIGGRGPGLRVVRSYSAFVAEEAKEAGAWGFGWSGSYSAHLVVNEKEATATVYQDNGSTAIFYKSGGAYTQGTWTEARLVKEGASYIYTLPDQSKLEFNSEGKLTKETDQDGNSNTLTYKEGRLEKVEDGDTRMLTFKYNGEGLVESVKDPQGHEVKYTYVEKQLATVTIGGKERWKFEYESPHLLKKITDGRGHVTTIKYEATTDKVTEEEFGGHKRKWEYKTGETKMTEPNGSETLETFNSAGEPTKTIRAKGKGEETVTEDEYLANTYALTKLLDPNKQATEYMYDSEGNRISEKDPEGDERKWEYNKEHEVTMETSPEGEATTITRNTKGEPTKIERPIGTSKQISEYKYAGNGDLEEEIDPLKNATSFLYDAAGDKETEKDPEGNERRWKYNSDSQVTGETSPRGFTTLITRNEQGWPTKVLDPLDHTTEYNYDGNGNVESETDGNGHTTKYEYNEENLRTRVEEPNKTLVETAYDSEGQMTSHTDGNKHVWEYLRNALEQVTEEKNPLGKTWKKTYEKAGNLEKLEDPEKHTTEYAYDKANRLKKINYSTAKPAEVLFEYNKDNRVKKMTDETGTTENTWDKLDRLEKYKNGAGKTIEYKYDLNNQPTGILYPNAKEVKREYDKDERLSKVTDWNTKATSFKYNADSQPEKTVFPGTENEDTYAYNEADQMSEVHYKHGATNLGSLVYERDKDGQVKKTTTTELPGPAISESILDENNRLIEAQSKAYKYDKANNPEEIEGTTGYAYNTADELEKGDGNTYTYNEDGQRTKTKPEATEHPATTYTYDQAENLTGVERLKEGVFEKIEDKYKYDGTNLRQTQSINGTSTNLTWDTAEALPLLLSDETNNYIYGPEELPVEQIATSGETTLYLHHDQQGSTRLLTNTTGTKETAYTYTPYGALQSSSGTASTPLRYDGQYTSTDTGLIYLRARTYDPDTAQFLTVDPALEETSEPYTYTADDPLNATDPSGECQDRLPPWSQRMCMEAARDILRYNAAVRTELPRVCRAQCDFIDVEQRLWAATSRRARRALWRDYIWAKLELTGALASYNFSVRRAQSLWYWSFLVRGRCLYLLGQMFIPFGGGFPLGSVVTTPLGRGDWFFLLP